MNSAYRVLSKRFIKYGFVLVLVCLLCWEKARAESSPVKQPRSDGQEFFSASQDFEKNGFAQWDTRSRYSKEFSNNLYSQTDYLTKLSTQGFGWYHNVELFNHLPIDPLLSMSQLVNNLKPKRNVSVLWKLHEAFLKEEFLYFTNLLNSNRPDSGFERVFYLPYQASFSRIENYQARALGSGTKHFDESASVMEYAAVLVVPMLGPGTLFYPHLVTSSHRRAPDPQGLKLDSKQFRWTLPHHGLLFRGWAYDKDSQKFEGILHDFPQNQLRCIDKRLAMVFFWVRCSTQPEAYLEPAEQ